LVQDHADDDKHGTKSDGILVVTGVQRMSKQILMSPEKKGHKGEETQRFQKAIYELMGVPTATARPSAS
jgi:hypothetical protein